jgi:SNF2 family DNA or RNA helicase
MKPVTVRRFIMKDTIEELIVKIQQRKNEMIGEFMTDK